MTVILADVLGYCMGVRRAVESAIASIDEANDVYTLGPLIHNKTALNSLEKKGLKVLNENKAEDAKIGSTVIIRAHGVPPSVNEIKRMHNYQRNLSARNGKSKKRGTLCFDELYGHTCRRQQSWRGYRNCGLFRQ